MLDMGFREDLEDILDAAPAGAPDPAVLGDHARSEIATLAKRYQQDAVRIATRRRQDAAARRHRLPGG